MANLTFKDWVQRLYGRLGDEFDKVVYYDALFNKEGNVYTTIKSQWLPSYIDDILEYANVSSFPQTGETGKIYLALDTGKMYRWSGSQYVLIDQTDLTNYYTKAECDNNFVRKQTSGSQSVASITNSNGGIEIDVETTVEGQDNYSQALFGDSSMRFESWDWNNDEYIEIDMGSASAGELVLKGSTGVFAMQCQGVKGGGTGTAVNLVYPITDTEDDTYWNNNF